MIDTAALVAILGAIIGSTITTIGNIVVAIIQSKKEGSGQIKGLLVPQNYILHSPKKYPFWLAFFAFIGAVLSVMLVYVFGLNTSLQSTTNLLILETIQFDYADSPINHGWKIIEGDSQQITFERIIDNKVGNALKISAPAENFYAMDYELIPTTSEFGDYLEIVTKFDDERTSIYTYVNMIRDNGTTQNGWLKFKIGNDKSLPSQKTTGEQEWVLYVSPVIFPNTSWAKMQIDLKKAVQDTFGIDGWSFNKLLKFRIRGSLSLDYIAIYEHDQK